MWHNCQTKTCSLSFQVWGSNQVYVVLIELRYGRVNVSGFFCSSHGSVFIVNIKLLENLVLLIDCSHHAFLCFRFINFSFFVAGKLIINFFCIMFAL